MAISWKGTKSKGPSCPLWSSLLWRSGPWCQDQQLLGSHAVDASRRAHGYDTNAIQGYNSKVAAEKLGLDPERYVPNMAIAIGKAEPDSSQ